MTKAICRVLCGFFILALSPMTAHPAPSSFISELNAIQDSKPDLKSFLNDPQAMAAYFKVFVKYIGPNEQPSERVFHRMMDQAKKLAAKSPEFAARAWSKEPLGKDFQIETESAQTSLVVNTEEWLKYVESLKATLLKKAAPIHSLSDPAQRSAEIQKELAALTERISKLDKNLPPEEIQKRILSLVSEPGFKFGAALAESVLQGLNHEEADELLRSTNGEVALQGMEKALKLAMTPGHVLATPPSSMKYASLLLPKSVDLRKDSRLMKSVTQPAGTIHFVAPRPFLALLRGFTVQECTGGCEKTIDWITPRRWAIPTLGGVNIHFVEVQNHLDGFVQYVPMHNKDNFKIMSVDMQAPSLRKEIRIKGEAGAPSVNGSLFQAWQQRVGAVLPEDYRKLAVGRSNAANNAQMAEYSRDSIQYRLGRKVGVSNTFVITDQSFADEISKLSPALEVEHHYGPGMTFDGVSSQSGDLRVLNTELQAGGRLKPEQIEKLWNDPAVERASVLLSLEGEQLRAISKSHEKEVKEAIKGLQDQMSIENQKLIWELMNGEPMYLHELTHVLALHIPPLEEMAFQRLQKLGGAKDSDIQNAYRAFLAARGDQADCSIAEEVFDSLFEVQFAKTRKSADDFIKTLSTVPGAAHYRTQGETRLTKAVFRKAGLLPKSKPTIEQAERVLHLLTGDGDRLAFVERVMLPMPDLTFAHLDRMEKTWKDASSDLKLRALAMERFHSRDTYLALIAPHLENPSSEHVAGLQEFASAHAHEFGFSPEVALETVRKDLGPTTEKWKAALVASLRAAKTPADFWLAATTGRRRAELTPETSKLKDKVILEFREKFFAMSPSAQWVTDVGKEFYDFPTAFLESALLQAKNPKDYLTIVENFQGRADAYSGLQTHPSLAAVIKREGRHFAGLDPTPDQKAKLSSLTGIDTKYFLKKGEGGAAPGVVCRDLWTSFSKAIR